MKKKDIAMAYKLEIALLKEENIKLKKLVSHDSLTGALSREEFLERAEYALAMSTRSISNGDHGQHFSLVFIDLDDFKRVNDENGGHWAGDNILKNFVQFLEVQLRDSDLIGRAGGDEFVLFLGDSDLNSGAEVVRKIEIGLKNHKLSTGDKKINISISCGIASTSEEGINNLENLIREADKEMYRIKKQKGNR